MGLATCRDPPAPSNCTGRVAVARAAPRGAARRRAS